MINRRSLLRLTLVGGALGLFKWSSEQKPEPAKSENLGFAKSKKYGPGNCKHPGCAQWDTLEYNGKGLCHRHQSKCHFCLDYGFYTDLTSEGIAKAKRLGLPPKQGFKKPCPWKCQTSRELFN